MRWKRLALVLSLLGGCARNDYAALAVMPSQAQETGGFDGDYRPSVAMEAASASPQAWMEEPPSPSPRGAAGAPPPPVSVSRIAMVTPTAPTVATDATRVGELRIYTADLVMAVYDVRNVQDAVVAQAEAVGGYLATRNDQVLVLRVPAERFDEVLEHIAGTGRLVQRNVEVQDVTERFRDLETRIRTLEAMRDRLEQLLARATDVEDALAVQQQLERITVELESLKGQLRGLGNRITYSTITLRFQVLAEERLIDPNRPQLLPLRWVQDLGLANLLRP